MDSGDSQSRAPPRSRGSANASGYRQVRRLQPAQPVPGYAESCLPGRPSTERRTRSGSSTGQEWGTHLRDPRIPRGEAAERRPGNLLRPNPTAHLTGVGRNPYVPHPVRTPSCLRSTATHPTPDRRRRPAGRHRPRRAGCRHVRAGGTRARPPRSDHSASTTTPCGTTTSATTAAPPRAAPPRRPPPPPRGARPGRRPGRARDGDRIGPARQAVCLRRLRPGGVRLLGSHVVRLPPRRLRRDAAHRGRAGALRAAHRAQPDATRRPDLLHRRWRRLPRRSLRRLLPRPPAWCCTRPTRASASRCSRCGPTPGSPAPSASADAVPGAGHTPSRALLVMAASHSSPRVGHESCDGCGARAHSLRAWTISSGIAPYDAASSARRGRHADARRATAAGPWRRLRRLGKSVTARVRAQAGGSGLASECHRRRRTVAAMRRHEMLGSAGDRKVVVLADPTPVEDPSRRWLRDFSRDHVSLLFVGGRATSTSARSKAGKSPTVRRGGRPRRRGGAPDPAQCPGPHRGRSRLYGARLVGQGPPSCLFRATSFFTCGATAPTSSTGPSRGPGPRQGLGPRMLSRTASSGCSQPA